MTSGRPERDGPRLLFDLRDASLLPALVRAGLDVFCLPMAEDLVNETGIFARELYGRGHRTLALWVLDTNPTRAWYARQGGHEAGEKTEPLPGGAELHEVRLVWDDLAALYLLRPELFGRRGGHWEPCVSVDIVRRLLSDYMAGKT